MKTKWIIQTNGINSQTLNDIFTSLKRLNIDYETFNTISKNNTITNIENISSVNDTSLISICGVSMLRIINSNEDLNLKRSIDYDIDKFDQYNYRNLDLPLLNSNAKYYDFKEIINLVLEKDMFIKPSKDIKSFNGGIINEGETILNYLYRTGGNITEAKKEKIILSELKNIVAEYRFFMYKNEVIDSSRYILNGKYSINNKVPEYMTEKAIEYSKLYIPNDLYVIDLAETDKDISIVEYNCWNICGFYDCDVLKIIGTINDIKSK